jgi:beta-phosphoglucomutase
MQWIFLFQLFLFDFDGLLVNTEHLHYQAYLNAIPGLQLTFQDFERLAHVSAAAWKEAVLAEKPELDWDKTYRQKKACYMELIGSGQVELMEGAEELLYALEKAGIKRCVVTHSPREQIEVLRNAHPALQTIPHWITREDYDKPKPDSECYLKAIAMYGKPRDKIIGFEDSFRGFKALSGTPATAVLIRKGSYPDAIHFESLRNVVTDHILLP